MSLIIRSKPVFIKTALVLAIAAVNSLPAFAQDVDRRSLILEEIVVTAQKREESLQDAPIAISAFSSDSIEQMGIIEVQDVSLYTPNMVGAIQPASSSTVTFNIRGITQAEPIMSVDPAVGVYMNGVYMARSNGLAFEVVDIERIEVLRGPQGTLYGRNSTGGAVNIVTKKPAGELAFTQKFSVGDRELFRSHTTLDTPEVAGLSAKASYLHSEVDGYIDNDIDRSQSLTGDTEDFGAKDSEAVNLAISWAATDTFSVDYNFDYTDSSNMPAAFQLTTVTPNFVAGPNPNPNPITIPGIGDFNIWPLAPGSNDQGFGDAVLAGTYASFGGTPTAPLCSLDPGCVGFANTPNPAFGGAPPSTAFIGGMEGAYAAGEENVDAKSPVDGLVLPYAGNEEVNIQGHSLSLNWDVADGLQIKSITAYRKMDVDQYTDLSGGGFNDLSLLGGGVVSLFAGNGSFKEQDQFSQEIQFLGTHDRLEYVAGLYYFEEEASESTQETLAPLLGSFGMRKSYTAENTALAAFGQATWTPDLLEDRLRITLGLRYTEDERDLKLVDDTGASGSFSEDFSNTSGAITLDYSFTDEVSSYAKFSTGYKAGGFMARTSVANQKPFDEETVESYEIGLKSELWDQRVRLNAAIFRNEFDDLQLSQFEPSTTGAETVLNNAGSATIQGFELDVIALLAEGLTVNFSYGYLDAKYDEYLFASPATGFVPVDVSDQAHFPMAAEQTATAGIQYDFAPFTFGELSARMDVSYNDGYQHGTLDSNFDQYTEAEAFTLVNGRITLSEVAVTDRSRLRFALWGKNLTDEQYRVFGITAFEQLGFAGAVFNEPRSYGVDVIYDFE